MMKNWMMIPAVVGMIACNSAETAPTTEPEVTDTTAAAVETIAPGELLYFGDTVTFDNAINTEEMMAMLAENDSAEVKVAGEISGVCTKKGCWMSMPIPNGDDMFVRYNYEFLLPTSGITGLDVVIEGKVKREVQSVDYLRHLAEDAGKTQEEIDAIVEPKTKVSFLATGVTIKS